MTKRNVVFFCTPLEEQLDELKATLQENFLCITSNVAEELNQSYHQAGKFAVIFNDGKSALNFLKEGREFLAGLDFRAYAYLQKNARYNAESEKKLGMMKVKAFPRSEAHLLIGEIKAYFSSSNLNNNSEIQIEDLEFIIPKESEDGTPSEN